MRTVPVYRSLHRRIFILGGEAELVQGASFVALLLGVGGMSKISVVTGILFWFVALNALQRMGKRDPYMGAVFMRHVKQKTFYAARSKPWKV